ncbi:hypothetical protein PpBr36_07230 [Pyricularia pennisetigena]|uniref:hypothetical protein n=1 Tax=Pyricularia pennisetigena TaxID=1578925 RepID=UPI0011542270|nr:hypothetical protein PpBr36_07230 [Pyricularia pennisetigena]TLS25142.1 hypothetical protein PpBr36_07230 [Pyricularia pennisetigena]
MARSNKPNRYRARKDTGDHARSQPGTPRPRGPRPLGRGAGCDRDTDNTAEHSKNQMHHRNGGRGGRGGGAGAGRKDKRGSLHQGSRKPRSNNKDAVSLQCGICGECRCSRLICSPRKAAIETIESNTAMTSSDGLVSSRQPPTSCTNCEAMQLHNRQLYESMTDVMVDWAREVGVDIEGDRDATASVDTEEMEWQREHVFIIPADHRKVTDNELLGLENARLGLAAVGGLGRVGGGYDQLLAQPWRQVEALARPAPALQYHPMDIADNSSVLDQASQWLIRQGMMSPMSEPSALEQGSEG